MEKISEAILDKVRGEAQDIIREAEEKARERIEKAREQHKTRFEEEKSRLIAAAEAEAARVRAKAAIMARQELLNVKNEVIGEVVSKVQGALSHFSSGGGFALNLIKEAVDAAGGDEVRVYVSPKEIASMRKLIEEDRQLARKIIEIKEVNCTGGVIVEDIQGKNRIDNTYDTRLEKLLPRILPEISKELFGAL